MASAPFISGTHRCWDQRSHQQQKEQCGQKAVDKFPRRHFRPLHSCRCRTISPGANRCDSAKPGLFPTVQLQCSLKIAIRQPSDRLQFVRSRYCLPAQQQILEITQPETKVDLQHVQ